MHVMVRPTPYSNRKHPRECPEQHQCVSQSYVFEECWRGMRFKILLVLPQTVCIHTYTWVFLRHVSPSYLWSLRKISASHLPSFVRTLTKMRCATLRWTSRSLIVILTEKRKEQQILEHRYSCDIPICHEQKFELLAMTVRSPRRNSGPYLIQPRMS